MISLSGESSHLSGARAIAVVGLVLGTACAAAAGAGLARLVAGLAPGADGVAIAIAAVFGLAAWTAVVGAIWVGIVRNGAVRVRTRWERAASLVDVQLKRRADLIPNLVAVTKGTAAHESSVQRAVAELRAGAASQGILRILAEAYPSLTADQAFLSLQRQLADTESRIAESRKFEIESRKALLERLSTFPEGAVARVMGVAMPPPSLAEPAPPPSSRAHPPRG
jgi:LemA protein